ncbi:MAG: cupin domain-containing protein [Casimicrobium sp.]
MPNPSQEHDRAALDDDIVHALAAAHAPDIASQRLVNRVRSRVMRTIAEQSIAQHSTIHAHENTWQTFLDKIEFKLLNHVDGVASYLLRMQPGAVLPAHRHPIDEECVVLEGELRIGDQLILKAGGFHLAKKDIPHADISTDTGALIFLRGAMPTAEDVV